MTAVPPVLTTRRSRQDASMTNPLLRAELHSDHLRVWFSDDVDDVADYHFRYLRHHAGTDRHPTTNEPTLCSSELPDDIHPRTLTVREDALVITWSDGSPEALYSRSRLRELAYGRIPAHAARLPHDLAAFTLHAADHDSLDALALATLTRVRRDGVCVVRAPQTLEGAQAATEPLIAAFERAGLVVRTTHFGRIEDLRPDNTTNANNDQLGYTTAPIDLHTDQPFIAAPPRYQLLQGIVAAAGGDNAFVDAFLAGEYLRARDSVDHALLAATKVRFHRRQRAFESLIEAPILSLRDAANPTLDGFQVRYSYFTLAPHPLPFAAMSAFYRAHDHFARIVRNPDNQLIAKLQAGDFVLYDNHRMLHARKPFSGPRWVRGVYFDPADTAGTAP
jgi:alpha-ketoglutarate-dependent taurine dioxygenase